VTTSPLVHSVILSPLIIELRWFAQPIGEIDAASGQPWKEYDASCNMIIRDQTAYLSLMQVNSLGNAALPAFREYMRANHPHVMFVTWERWKGGEKKTVKLEL
jgi:hypothetical protein